MKRIVSFAIAALMIVTIAGPAVAGAEESVAVGTASLSRSDLEQIRDRVAGRDGVTAAVPAAEERVDAGRVELSRQDLERIRALVSGAGEAAGGRAQAAEATRNVGRVDMSQAEFDTLKRLVDRRAA